MTGGLLILSPQRSSEAGSKLNLGKPSQAIIQSDGTFTMGTYGKNDGAVIGKHRVELNLAVLEDGDPKPPCKFAAKDLMVEVKSGKNVLTIDLADSGTSP